MAYHIYISHALSLALTYYTVSKKKCSLGYRKLTYSYRGDQKNAGAVDGKAKPEETSDATNIDTSTIAVLIISLHRATSSQFKAHRR